MPTPPKPVKVLEMEKRSHRTKNELAQRRNAEAALLTGVPIKEKPDTKANKIAHKEFTRIKKLLKNIDKDDDLYGETINRYCILVAECEEFQGKKKRLEEQLVEFQNIKDCMIDDGELSAKEAFTIELNMQKNIIALDSQLQSKRKMLLDMEKENVMTIASSLRSIPKKVDKKKNALMEALGG